MDSCSKSPSGVSVCAESSPVAVLGTAKALLVIPLLRDLGFGSAGEQSAELAVSECMIIVIVMGHTGTLLCARHCAGCFLHTVSLDSVSLSAGEVPTFHLWVN